MVNVNFHISCLEMSAVGLQVSLSNKLRVLISIRDLLGKLGFMSLELKEQLIETRSPGV